MQAEENKKSPKGRKKTDPIDKQTEVDKNPDAHIDQDFPGYPHGLAKNELINPKSKTQKKTAGISSPKNK